LCLPFDVFDELGDFVAVWAGECDSADLGIIGEVFSSGCASAMGAADLANIKIAWEVDVGFDYNAFGLALSPVSEYDSEDEEDGCGAKE
jgi:hypothetical protein